jgi:LAO/AO transport system kinase
MCMSTMFAHFRRISCLCRKLTINMLNKRLYSTEITIDPTTKRLADRLLTGDRGALSRAITLVESKLYNHHITAQQLLQYIASKKLDRDMDTFRIGVSGPPGVGKSTFIESLGMKIIEKGEKVAVLAVDPSSTLTGGSILGDKTRMIDLTGKEEAFIRPSPSQGFLGGVTANTYEVVSLCEAAGYDRIIIETVGVGQSETQIADLTDMVLLLLPPAGGDELQGIKKGIMEIADLIIINKADGKLINSAKKSTREIESALHFYTMRHSAWQPRAMMCTSLTQASLNPAQEKKDLESIPKVSDVLKVIDEFRTIVTSSSDFKKRRAEQRKSWMWKQVNEELITRMYHYPAISEMMVQLQNNVGKGLLSPRIAASRILDRFVKEYKPE